MNHAWVYNDGGRKDAGFKGAADDCVTRAIAIVTGKPYREVYDTINRFAMDEKRVRGKIGKDAAMGKGSSARKGVAKRTTRLVMKHFGLEWTPTMQIGTGCRVHLNADELPVGRIIASVSRHVVAVVDGVVYDTHDSTRDGRRCVYGYYQRRTGR